MCIILNEHLTKRFHVSVRLFSDRSQMTSKCGKTMKWRTGCTRVCHWCLSHFDVFCDLLLNKPTATWNLFVLYNDQKSTKTDTHTCIVPLDCSRICASLGIFLIPNATFRLGFFFPSLSYLYTVLGKVWTSSLAQSRIMAKTFCKAASLSASVVAMADDGNCCEDFLQFRRSQV